ncbi:MAG: hypothetical protein MJ113_06000 [Lachnospiraceae bacterium]|nr:hypothetical protein [Lachnospiraceae bacterium]
MTKDVYNEMTEFMKEEPESVIDYLESVFDELEWKDLKALAKSFIPNSKIKNESDDEKEKIFEELLDAMYALCDERPKEFIKKIQNFKMMCT